ncbi:MAG: hypothetical protein EAX96_10720 [Candidatus Lokiarchaeota archaeon]|nr:hypothetical protein [Candidatus Lokiarchaeota archaeon]
MNDFEEIEGEVTYEKIKLASKIIAITLISLSFILRIISIIISYGIYEYFPELMAQFYFIYGDQFYLFLYSNFIFLFIIIIISQCISVPGFVALGIYAYFLFLRLENYLFIRSTSYQRKLKHRTYFLILLEYGIFTAWSIFGLFIVMIYLIWLTVINIINLVLITVITVIYLLLQRF